MKKIFLFCLIFFIITTCKKEDFNIVNLNGNKIIALGHAGMGVGNTYPMNSYESILKCLNLGMDGTEFDVQMTEDSILVAYHGQDLSDETNIKGLINSLKWNDIKNAHYTNTPYLNYSIISLDQLFSNIENIHKYKFTFDCKLYTNTNNTSQFFESYINSLVGLIQKHQIEENIYIESNSIEFLKILKNKHPNFKLFIYSTTFEFGLETASFLNLYGITIASRNITKDQIKIAHDNNLFVAIWNIHTESDNIEAINKNPDFIQTDNVKSLIKLIK